MERTKIFLWCFHSALVLLIHQTKLSCLQNFFFGHTRTSFFFLGLLPNQCWRWGRMSPFWIFCPFFLSPWCTVYYYDSKILGPCFYFAELDYGLFRHRTFDFWIDHPGTGSATRNWYKVKTWLDQMFWQIYQKLMLTGFLSSGNLFLIHHLKLFWPHTA